MGGYLVSANSPDSYPVALSLINERLEQRGLPVIAPNPAPVDFEEKLYGSGDAGLDELLREFHGDEVFPYAPLYADLWLPSTFDGVVDLKLPGIYQPTLQVVSAPGVIRDLRPIASTIGLPDDVPNGENLSILVWFEELDPTTWAGATGSDRWLTDLEASKDLAQYLRAAEYATTHQIPIIYSQWQGTDTARCTEASAICQRR